MIIYTFVVVLLLWVVQRQWKMRKILTLSRKLRNKYVALPIIGHGLMFFGTGEDRMKALQRLAHEAIKSPFRLTSVWLGPCYFAVTCDPEIIEIVCKASLGKPEVLQISQHLWGNGSLFASVNIWRLRRKMLAPTFSTKHVNSFKEIFAEQSFAVTSCLKFRAGRGTFSIWNNMLTYAVNSVCQTTLGIKVKALDQPFHPFLSALQNYLNIMSAILFKPWLHWVLLFKLTLLHQNAEKYKSVIHDFIDDIIRNNKKSLECRHNATSMESNTAAQSYTPYSTLQELLMTSSDGSNRYTDLELREEALVILIAATETSAVTASFTTVMLSRYSDVQEKAYEELRDIFGDSKRPVTHEDLSRLTYIDAIVKETLRLYPPVPVIARQNEEDVKLRITLPAGSGLIINIWGLHRNLQYWGVDADVFNPDRFLNGSITNPLAYMPFSCGPRNCIGNKYAMMSIKIFVATLLRDYKVLPPSDMSSEDLKTPLRVEFNITMKDADNFKVRLEHRA